MILRERESQYEQEIDEYQKNLELSIIQNQNIQSELADLQQEKESNENTLNDIINSLKEDFEKQIQILKTQNIESQEHRSYFFFFPFFYIFLSLLDNAHTNELTQNKQELNEYQTKLDQLNEQIIELNQQNEAKLSQIHQLKTELDQKHQANKQITNMKQQYEQTQNELIQRVSLYIIETKTTFLLIFRQKI
jgi:hypothetical protein